MQFGVFSVADVTRDPTTGRTPSDTERIRDIVAIARHAETVGLDVFGLGEHHSRPFASSAPVVTLAYLAAATERILLATATNQITINDPVHIAEHFATLQILCNGRLDLMLGRGNVPGDYPTFGYEARDGIEIAVEHYGLLRRLWSDDVLDWEGLYRGPLEDFTATPRPLDSTPPFIWHASMRSPEIVEQAGYYGDGLVHNNVFWPFSHVKSMIEMYRDRYEYYGHGTAEEAIVGLGGQVYLAERSQDAIAEFRPYFNEAPIYGGGMPLEDYMRETALAVGSKQQVIDRFGAYVEEIGYYQRQWFLIDHGGLPLTKVLRQLDFLAEVVPELRRIIESKRTGPHVPLNPPSHADLVASPKALPREFRWQGLLGG